MNLRLPDATTAALEAQLTDRQRAWSTLTVQPARIPYRKVRPRLRLRKGETSLELLDRDDRF